MQLVVPRGSCWIQFLTKKPLVLNPNPLGLGVRQFSILVKKALIDSVEIGAIIKRDWTNGRRLCYYYGLQSVFLLQGEIQ